MGSYQNLQPDKREKKAAKIVASGDSIKQLTKNVFEVRSQSWDVISYRVERLENNQEVFSCTCKDFQFRIANSLGESPERACKHIKSVRLYLKQKELVQRIEQTPELPRICPSCHGTQFVKNGFRVLKTGVKRQRYSCIKCNRRFILGEQGFSKIADPSIVTEALNLIFSGLSYRACVRHLNLAHGTDWSHTTLLFWVRKYTQIIKNFVDTLKPELGDVWSIDEMMLNVKGTKPTGVGFYDWAWSIISPQTRFILATEISKKRETTDARKIIAKGKENAKGEMPSYLISDSLMSYRDAFVKELDARRTLHIKTNSLTNGFQNRPIERWHNEVRQISKARRGLGNDRSAQDFMDGYRIYHNFARPHTGLPDNKTPAEAAGIDLKLSKQNPMKDLIVKAAVHAEKESSFESYVINQLGKRFEKLTIHNEKDCIKFKQKTWIEKELWREINDILRINGFSWLSNGKDSCWIKMVQS